MPDRFWDFVHSRALDGLLAQHATLPGLEAIQGMTLPELTQFVQGLARRYEELAP
jgi:hypothetical protein